jgi:hypothetical protein
VVESSFTIPFERDVTGERRFRCEVAETTSERWRQSIRRVVVLFFYIDLFSIWYYGAQAACVPIEVNGMDFADLLMGIGTDDSHAAQVPARIGNNDFGEVTKLNRNLEPYTIDADCVVGPPLLSGYYRAKGFS